MMLLYLLTFGVGLIVFFPPSPRRPAGLEHPDRAPARRARHRRCDLADLANFTTLIGGEAGTAIWLVLSVPVVLALSACSTNGSGAEAPPLPPAADPLTRSARVVRLRVPSARRNSHATSGGPARPRLPFSAPFPGGPRMTAHHDAPAPAGQGVSQPSGAHLIDVCRRGRRRGRVLAISPRDGRKLASVADGGEAEVNAAVAAARRAFDPRPPGPALRHPRTAAAPLIRVAELLDAHRRTGPSPSASKWASPSPTPTTSNCGPSSARSAGTGQLAGQTHRRVPPAHARRPRPRRHARPAGVVGAKLVPWNLPLTLAGWKVAPAPGRRLHRRTQSRPRTRSLSRSSWAASLLEATASRRASSTSSNGTGPVTGRALGALHPDVDVLAFTGSLPPSAAHFLHYAADPTSAGLAFPNSAASHRASSLPDAPDLEKAASPPLAWGIFFNQGEMCTAPSRLPRARLRRRTGHRSRRGPRPRRCASATPRPGHRDGRHSRARVTSPASSTSRTSARAETDFGARIRTGGARTHRHRRRLPPNPPSSITSPPTAASPARRSSAPSCPCSPSTTSTRPSPSPTRPSTASPAGLWDLRPVDRPFQVSRPQGRHGVNPLRGGRDSPSPFGGMKQPWQRTRRVRPRPGGAAHVEPKTTLIQL